MDSNLELFPPEVAAELDLKPTYSNRGFASFDPIGDTYGSTVTVRESSSAEAPCVWVAFEVPPSFDHPGGIDLAAHLSLAAVTKLRDQLSWMIESHYHVAGSDRR